MSTHAVLAPEALLTEARGVGDSEGLDDRVRLALVTATRIWLRLVGDPVGDEPMTPPYSVTTVAASAEVIQAVLQLAVRCYRNPDAAFGVIQAGDVGVAVRRVFPDMAPFLFGRRRGNAWGIA
jgi:hypothetical protein